MVEDRVDRRPPHAVDLDELVVLWHQVPHPDADVRVRAKRSIGNLQNHTEYVLVEEEVTPRKLEVVQEPQQVEEERVAAQSRVELVWAGLRCSNTAVEVHGSMINDHLAPAVISSSISASGPAHCRSLPPIDLCRESDPICDLRDRVGVRIELA